VQVGLAERSPGAPSSLAPLLLVALAGCGNEPADWKKRLSDPDRYEGYLAALALCVEKPSSAGPALPLVFERLEDPFVPNRAASQQALSRLEEEARSVLFEYLVLEGREQPLVREALMPVLERAPRAERRSVLELVRKHGWNEAPELRKLLLEDARSDPDWTAALRAELDREGLKGKGELRRFLLGAGVELPPERAR